MHTTLISQEQSADGRPASADVTVPSSSPTTRSSLPDITGLRVAIEIVATSGTAIGQAAVITTETMVRALRSMLK